MNDSFQALIANLLNKNKITPETQAPHDYASMKALILQLELQQEVTALQTMLDAAETFARDFKARCRHRETDSLNTIAFEDIPESATNRLYWDIAKVVFEPRNLKEMLAILLPSVNLHVTINLEHPRPGSFPRSELHNVTEPVLRPLPYIDDLLAELPAEFDLFARCIIDDRTIFNVYETVDFPLTIHAKLHTRLQTHYPKLAKKLYSHNVDFQTLEIDILKFKNNGMTPKAAILSLIKGLTIGGTKMTGANLASENALAALHQFLDYYRALPDDIRTGLRALASNNYQIATIIDDEIERGKCVETTAAHLDEILKANKENPVLNRPPAMTRDQIQKLEAQYACSNEKPNGVLSAKKTSHLITTLPRELTKQVVGRIAPNTPEALIILLFDFSPSLYDLLWSQIKLGDAEYYIKSLTRAIAESFYNPEQEAALIKALAKNYQRFASTLNRFFIVMARSLEWKLLQEIIPTLPVNERFKALSETDKELSSLLHYSATLNPQSLQYLLQLLPESDRLPALTCTDAAGNTPLQLALALDINLQAILSLLPEQQRIPAVSPVGPQGDTMFHLGAHRFESLQTLLALYPTDQQLKLVTATNHEHTSVLQTVASSPRSLKLILTMIPEADRVKAIMQTNKMKENLLHLSVDTAKTWPTAFECLQTIFEFIPHSKRLPAIMSADNKNMTLLQHVAHNEQSLQFILDNTPKHLQRQLAKNTDINGLNFLHHAAKNPRSLEIILDIFPKHQHFDALMTTDNKGRSVFHLGATHVDSIKSMLSILSPDQRIAAFTLEDDFYDTLLRQQLPALKMQALLLLLPLHQRVQVITHANSSSGHTLLHLCATQPLYLEAILSLIPEEQRLAALQKENYSDRSTIHRCVHYSGSLKKLFELLPVHQHLMAAQTTNQYGKNLLSMAIADPESLHVLLNIYPEVQRSIVICKPDDEGNTALHINAQHPKSLTLLLSLLPAEQRIPTILIKNKKGETVLDRTGQVTESLRILLSYFPENERLQAVSKLTLLNDTTSLLISSASNNPNTFAVILNLLPVEQRLSAMRLTDKNGMTPLLASAEDRHMTVFKSILALYPANEQLQALQQTDHHQQSVLHKAAIALSVDLLTTILNIFPGTQRLDELKKLDKEGMSVIHYAAKSADLLGALLATLPTSQQSAVGLCLDGQGRHTLLHAAVSDHQSLSMLLALIPEQQRREVIDTVNKAGKTVLQCTTSYSESLRIILALYPEDQRVAAVLHSSSETFSLLQSIHQFSSMQAILDLLSANDRHKVLLVKDANDQTFGVLCNTTLIYETIKVILEKFPIEQRLAIAQLSDPWGKSLLSEATSNRHALNSIIDLLPQQDRYTALTTLLKNGVTVLFDAIHHLREFQCDLKKILDGLPEEQRLAVVQSINNNGESLIHAAVDNPAALNLILQLYPANQQAKLILSENAEGESVLHAAAQNSESLEVLLSFFPAAQRITAILATDMHGQTLLQKSAPNYPSLELLLKKIPMYLHPKLLHHVDKQGRTLLHWAAHSIQSMEKVLSLYPENSRLTAMQILDHQGQTLLHKVAKSAESLQFTLKQFPIYLRYDAVNRRDNAGCTPLHIASIGINTLQTILRLLPQQQRLPALTGQLLNGTTLLQSLVAKPNCLQNLIALVPENQRLQLVLQKNKQGHPLLPYAVSGGSWKIILSLYPLEQRLDALKQTDHNGIPLMQTLAGHSENLSITLALLPENQRSCVMTQPAKMTPPKILKSSKPTEIIPSQVDNSEPDLHKAAQNFKSLQLNLALIPVNERLQAVKLENKQGKNVLQLVTNHAQALQLILGVYPDDQRLAACLSILDDVLVKGHVFKAMLAMLHEHHLFAFLRTEKDGMTVFEKLAKHSANLSLEYLEFKHPSAAKIIEVFALLQTQKIPTACTNARFFEPSPGDRLRKALLDADGFDSMLACVKQFVLLNPELMLSRKLSNVVNVIRLAIQPTSSTSPKTSSLGW